jgi:hypothetical protein
MSKQTDSKERPKGRTNREIVKEINDDNHLENPTSGATLPKGKDNTNCEDTIRGHEHKQNQFVFDATESRTQSQRSSVNREIPNSAIPSGSKTRSAFTKRD